MAKATIAVIVGNRDFFPDRLISEGRQDILQLFQELDIEPVILSETDTKLGAVETWAQAKRCAELFKAHRERIDGVLVTLPNFGDEKGVADTLKLSGLDVPVLVQAYPDNLKELNVERRRDAFCGKISACSNLRQYRIPFSLTTLHTVHPLDESFLSDFRRFIAIGKVVKGLKNARVGAIGARPNAFNTVRYSEKLLEESGISVSTIDLSEIIGKAQKLPDSDPRIKQTLAEINAYAGAGSVPQAPLVAMAKLSVVIRDWMRQYDLNATAIQCWTSLQENYGVNPCTLMSMMSEQLLPSACEVDITGVVAMYALQLASNRPSALVDWNNNYGDDPGKCVFFHCGNWAKSFLPDIQIKTADILETTLGAGKTYGAVAGRTPAGPLTFARVSTDDTCGIIRAYVGEGLFTDDPLETFGARAVAHVPNLQGLMQYICNYGFEHHVAMNASQTAGILYEAFDKYLNWDVYLHM
ncbi:MAG: L-fucose/L-arabinose isomerase family protein [bacterium]